MSRPKSILCILCVSADLILSACGGAGDEVYTPPPEKPVKEKPATENPAPDDPDPEPDPDPDPDPEPEPANVYETIYSEAATTSGMRGNGFAIPFSGQEATDIDLRSITGSVRHDVGPLSIDDGQYVFTGTMQFIDPDDPDQGVYFSDGNGGVFFLSAFDGTTFDYVMLYNGEYKIGSETFSAEGVAGIVTQDSDLPDAGSATYAGVAFGSGARTGGSFQLPSGTASALADFGAGTLNLTADSFSATGAPIDEIQVTGAIIDGAAFGGGSVFLFKDGASAEDILGANTRSQFGGNFYGYDDIQDIPDEVAGALLKAGDDGYVALYFAAD